METMTINGEEWVKKSSILHGQGDKGKRGEVMYYGLFTKEGEVAK